MKISVITVVRNNEGTIKDAIDSVLSQTYNNIEYIVVDGASTDGTTEIIKSYRDGINKFISEPDNGLYDAMNKGIKLATGDIVGILNSDDFYINENIIEKVVNSFKEQRVDSVFADLIYVKQNNTNRVVRYYDSSRFKPKKFAYGWMPAHPTFFVRRWVYEKYGLYKTDYVIAADFDVLARFLYRKRITFFYLKEPLIKMRMGGNSTSFRSIWLNSLEQLRACRENGISTNIFKILMKYPRKILGFLNK